MGYVYYPMQIGYGSSLTTNINDLTIIDENAVFPIITGTPPVTGNYTFSEFASMMADTIGSGYYILDGVGKISSPYLDMGRLWFPNLNILFQTINDYLNTNPSFSGYTLWFIIPKMHRVFRTASSVQNPVLYKLNDDGTMSSISMGNAWNIIPAIITGQSLYWFVCSGSTLSEIQNANNWSYEYSLNFAISDPNTKRALSTSSRSLSQAVITAIFSEAEEPEIPKTDPFAPGGESGTGGGTGDFDGTSDPIDFPDLPSLSAVDAGFITLFNPSASQLKSLSSYMWSNSLFDLDTWKKIFADPMDAILGLTIVPVNVPSGGSGPVTVGNIPTDINMTYAATQYVEVDCGTLNVNEYWGAYLDYEPFTKAEIYLPYIGTHAISVDDIMGKEVHVKYHIDILSGACAAYVKCGDSVLYTFIGQCASSIPISGSDMTNVINGVISAAVSIGSMVATGGASAPLAAPALANTAVNHMKPNIEKSGSMSGTGGLLAIQSPYLILTRPRQCLPSAQNEYMGYPAFISRVLGEVSGYTEVEQVHLDGITATEAEITEIENLLKSGVIL